MRGELAAVEDELSRRLSLYGRRMPMKKIVPVLVGISSLHCLGPTYRCRKSECARRLAGSLEGRRRADLLTLRQ